MKRALIILASAALLLAPASAYAAGNAATAGAQSVQISLKAGEDTVIINGKAVKVEKPVESEGTTLVPLRVITEAFGAGLSWDEATQTVGLTYGDKNIQLRVDSKEATVNGEKSEMSVAARAVNGTTLVPIRFIVENFGAQVGYDSSTGMITITLQAAADAAPASINTDYGKTKVGDSYYGWTMAYPSNLVLEERTSRGGWERVSFNDAKGDYSVYIYIEDANTETMSDNTLQDKAEEGFDGTLVESRMVQGSAGKYARVVYKNDDGSVDESRAFFHDGRLYYATLSVKSGDNYNDAAKYATYKELLDSFSVSFRQDGSIKDLTTVNDGYRGYTDDNTGVSFELPASWEQNDSDGLTFSSPDGSLSAYIGVHSLAEGDTVDAWVKRDMADFAEEYVPDYASVGPITDASRLEPDGYEARQVTYEYRNSDKWYATTGIYAVKDGYKYEVDFMYPKEKENDPAVKDAKARLASSLRIHLDRSKSNLGYIRDPKDALDKTVLTKQTNDSFKFSLTVPEYWKRSDFASGTTFSFVGGALSIAAYPSFSFADGLAAVKATIEKEEGVTVKSTGTATIAGESAQMFVFEVDNNGRKDNETTYAVEHAGTFYMIDVNIAQANSTDAKRKMLDDAVASIQFK